MSHRTYIVASIEPTVYENTPWEVTITGGMRPVTYMTNGTREQVMVKAERVVERINARPEWAITVGMHKDKL